jgi:hypothetical protein
VQVSNRIHLAAVYMHHGEQALVAIADWSPGMSNNYSYSVSLQCNWTALGLSPTTAKLHVPAVPPFQTQNTGVFSVDHVFEISASQGGLIVVIK